MKNNEERAVFADLASRLRSDDEEALADVLKLLGGKGTALIRASFGGQLSPEDIEDVLAITLSKIWQIRHKLDPEKGNVGSLFYLMTRRAAIDLLRRRIARPQEVSLQAEVGLDLPDSAQTDPPRTLTQEQTEIVKALIEKLPQRERRVVESGLGGKGSEEQSRDLAQELGISLAALRQVRLRLLRKMKMALIERGISTG